MSGLNRSVLSFCGGIRVKPNESKNSSHKLGKVIALRERDEHFAEEHVREHEANRLQHD